jgi:hypothetical protein
MPSLPPYVFAASQTLETSSRTLSRPRTSRFSPSVIPHSIRQPRLAGPPRLRLLSLSMPLVSVITHPITRESASLVGTHHPVSAAPVKYLSTSETVSSRPDLASAGKVVSGGRALNTKDNFGKYIEPLADALGAGQYTVDSNVSDSRQCDLTCALPLFTFIADQPSERRALLSTLDTPTTTFRSDRLERCVFRSSIQEASCLTIRSFVPASYPVSTCRLSLLSFTSPSVSLERSNIWPE